MVRQVVQLPRSLTLLSLHFALRFAGRLAMDDPHFLSLSPSEPQKRLEPQSGPVWLLLA